MSELKKGQAITARTVRGDDMIAGTVTELTKGTKGLWITVQPNDQALKSFKTRPALCKPN